VASRATVRAGLVAAAIEGLAEDYGALRARLGERRFRRLVRELLAARPTRSEALGSLTAALPSFVARAVPGDAFAAALARLELAVAHALRAPADPALSPDVLAATPPGRWPRVRLAVGASVRLLRLPTAVVDHYTTRETGAKPRERRTASITLCVWRQDGVVRRRELPQAAGRVLRRLQRGLTLRQALAGSSAEAPIDAWFAQWRADGLFTALR